MPIFDRNRIVVTCDFDDNIVVVGGNITGTINIYILEPVTLCGASLRYHIDESHTRLVGGNGAKPEPTVLKTSYNIEYVLFGHRNSKKTPPTSVQPGHYKYPFVVAVPANSPPSTSIGAITYPKTLKKLSGHSVIAAVDHRIDVVVYVANSLMDNKSTYTVPMVVKCASPGLLASTLNGREASLKKGMSKTISTRGTMLHVLFSGLSNPTKEQADCDLFIYNTAVSHAETPFLPFAIRGSINCPYYITLVRVIGYGKGGHKAKTEEIVSTLMMPPLDSPQDGVRGRLILSPHAMQSATTFTSQFLECSFYVTLNLIYTEGIDAGIYEENRVHIPIDVSHGSLVGDAIVSGSVVEAGVAALDGAVMGYTCPEGLSADFVPIAPVTEGNVAPAAWGGHASHLRYNRGGANNNANGNNDTTTPAPGNTAPPQQPQNSTAAQATPAAGNTTAHVPSYVNNARNVADYYPQKPQQQLQEQSSVPDRFSVPPSAQAQAATSASHYEASSSSVFGNGPIFDEHGRPLNRTGNASAQPSASSKTAAPLPPHQ